MAPDGVAQPSKNEAFFKAYAWLTAAAILIAITCFGLVQGVLTHVSGNVADAFLFYFMAWVCLGLGVVLFLKGKRLLHIIAISE